MNILEYYNINSTVLSKYVDEAKVNYDANLFSNENIIHILNNAELLEDNIKKVYINFVPFIDDNLREYLHLIYYSLFKTKEDFTFTYLSSAFKEIVEPVYYKKNHFGMAMGTLYIVASTVLYNFVTANNLDIMIYKRYFEKFNYFSNQNKFLHNTFGIYETAGFLYGYARGSLMWIGNLTFQIVKYNRYCEVYKDENGKKVFVATNRLKYNDLGLLVNQEMCDGYIPPYEINDNILTCNVFNENGRLCFDQVKLNLTEYQKILKPGDNVVTVHIPAGKSLDIDECKKSIKMAKEIFTRFFDNVKAVVCLTWFITPECRHLLKEGGNMQKFADLFNVITVDEDTRYHHLYIHIFEKSHDIPLSELVPTNDFQKRFLDLALRGDKMYKGYGLLRDDI